MYDYNDIWDLVSHVFCRGTEVERPCSFGNQADSENGREFERAAGNELCNIALRQHGSLFSNLYVSREQRNSISQIDHVLLLADRLIVVECKDYGGLVDCTSLVSRDGKPYWKQVTKSGEIHYLYSPVAQNQVHVSAVGEVTNVSARKCYSLVLFSNRSKLLHVPDITASVAVLQLASLHTLDFRPVPSRLFSSIKYNSILKKLEQCVNVDADIIHKHRSIANALSNTRPKISAPTVCPRCGSALVLRYVPSKFLGCSMYPLCDYTYSLGDD